MLECLDQIHDLAVEVMFKKTHSTEHKSPMLQPSNLEKRLAALPEEARREVADLITALEAQYTASPNPTDTLRNDPFIGCWKDRDDLDDSTAWVRRLRQKEWETADE